ncbi:hypothetical protein CH352_10155 [Leptospira hartskeerlii]|uniref:Uncharacterized protein n=1 Tax=Leptospira hartskeerlii TaxID=2023177 RepID=A0A2M9XBK1_9LEPT|nr:hypothetical protein [Leptospira hartskeerlii]PJZ24932.1 hypothetical protein CH357_11960 [Leptospira hartskeerlii]PJZ33324.1 hypothetical protein CH352_10155 [Leptospira hartskeerlii]
MQTLAKWPSPSELSFSDGRDAQSEIPNSKEYFQSVLAWAKENGAEEYFLVPLEEWVPSSEVLSSLPSYPVRTQMDIPDSVTFSYAIPPVLFGNKLCFWTSEGNSLTDSYIRVLGKMERSEEQLSKIFETKIRSIPEIIWKEEEKHSNSLLLERKLWGRKENGKRYSSSFSLAKAFFVGSLTDIREIDEYELVFGSSSDLEAAIQKFLYKRADSKYFSLLSALGKSGSENGSVFKPKIYFSFGLQLLILSCVLAEAYDELVSRWIEERPVLKDAIDKLEEWTEKEFHPKTDAGMDAIFEEKVIHLLDKYSDRTDRFLLKRLEEEYQNSQKDLSLHFQLRKKEIEEKLIPDLLSQVESHSKFSFPEELKTEWENLGKTLQYRLENLLLERKNLPNPEQKGNGKTPESWNILIGHRSD